MKRRSAENCQNGSMSFGGGKNMSKQKKPAGGLNIIIVGWGKVGTTLVEQLVKEGSRYHDSRQECKEDTGNSVVFMTLWVS